MIARPASAPALGPASGTAAAPAFRASGARSVAIDAVRGAALVGMALFHLAWDLHFFGYSAIDPMIEPAWHGLGNGVAFVFLCLSGLGLVLADRAGHTPQRIAARLIRIAIVAAGLTGVSLLFVPEAPILFGILHCLVAANLIALAMLRLPMSGLLIGVVVAFALPTLFKGLLPSTGSVAWIGLSATIAPTLDFRPLLPWLGAVLMGVVIGRFSPLGAAAVRFPVPAVVSWLGLAGRHSLAIYLLHQPILFASFMLLAWGSGHPVAIATGISQPHQPFELHCRNSCQASGSSDTFCSATCRCATKKFSASNADQPNPSRRLAAIARSCVGVPRPNAP